MANDRSLQAFDKQHKSTEAFDYFVCGVAGAIFAYIVKDYAPQKLDLDLSLLTPIALLLLACSFFAGLKRLESTAGAARINAVLLDASEKAGHITDVLFKPVGSGEYYNAQTGEFDTVQTLMARRESYLADVRAARAILTKGIETGARYYTARNRLLILGFIAILAAKIALPYTNAATRTDAARSATDARICF